MTTAVFTTDNHTLFVPSVCALYIRRAISQGQATPSSVRKIGAGTVQQQVGVHGHLTGFELDIHRFSKSMRIIDCLRQYVLLFSSTISKLKVTVPM